VQREVGGRSGWRGDNRPSLGWRGHHMWGALSRDGLPLVVCVSSDWSVERDRTLRNLMESSAPFAG